MADYEPFPTGADEVVDDRTLAKRIVGCFGCGGLGVMGFLGAVAVLVVGLGSMGTGCDLELGDPGKGTDSARLPVGVAPRTQLDDGTAVRVTSTAFDADEVVGVAVCLRAADTERKGVDACDENQGARYATDGDGHLDATYPVPRVITVDGKAYDCAASPERCIVVAADAGDYDRSGGRPISFRSGLPAADLTRVTTRATTDRLPIGSEPSAADPIPAGTDLTLLASGFQPGEPLLLAYCTSDLEEQGMIESCDPVDPTLAVKAIMGRSVDGDFPRADERGGFTTSLPARSTVTPYGEDLGRALGEFTSSTTTTGPSTTTTSTPDPARRACTAEDGGCSIVIAAAADTKRSAVLPYVVTG